MEPGDGAGQCDQRIGPDASAMRRSLEADAAVNDNDLFCSQSITRDRGADMASDILDTPEN
ncbi:hypothetical protein [Streptomyces sp. NBC_01794]|uniref:hypothetical protein n=1 Tax=Streptomyces sp. NBC_01794 TaxID=2975942 RepID=UPI00308CAE16|nr:hypothetical protein OIE54_40765 [Streptomyces sp. NBC_01794]